MGIKQDRPADHGDDGVVVYVAKSRDEVDRARAALEAAGVAIELPAAAIEALFAAGRQSLPLRVPAADFRKAQDVIDELFPPPLLELPPLPGQAKPGAAASEASPSEGPQVDGYDPQPSSAPSQQRQLETSASKVLVIALASFFLPGLGALLGAFAAWSAWWCYDQLPYGSGARSRAALAGLLGLGALALWIGLGLKLALGA